MNNNSCVMECDDMVSDRERTLDVVNYCINYCIDYHNDNDIETEELKGNRIAAAISLAVAVVGACLIGVFM